MVFNAEEQARVSIPIVGAKCALDCVLFCSWLPQGRHQGPSARRSLAMYSAPGMPLFFSLGDKNCADHISGGGDVE
jgi:hypothetical protein